MELYTNYDFFISERYSLLIICIFLPVFLLNKILKFKQLSVLSGDSITHILFHNLRKKELKLNVCGVVGGEIVNLPSLLYRCSSFIFPSYKYGRKINIVVFSNLFFLTILESLVFCVVLINRGLMEALLALLCVGLIPSISVLSWSEKGSYSKFSERFLALFFNGIFVYYSLQIAHGSDEPSTVALASICMVLSFYLGKFSRQVIVFWFILLLVIAFDSTLFYPLICCCFFIFFDSNLRNEISAQLIYLKNYKSYQSQNFEVSKVTIKRLLKSEWLSERKLLRIYIRLFLHSGVGIIIMLPTAYLLFYGKGPDLEILFFISIFIALITSSHVFYFIGSGDRYMYHFLTMASFLTICKSGASLSLIFINGVIVLIYLIANARSIFSISKAVRNKCIAFSYFYKIIGLDKTVFFDHYKDGEIFQLIHNLYNRKFKTSTSSSYLWNENSKIIFSNYPKISFKSEILSLFSVDFIVTERTLSRADLELVHEFSGFNLYRVFQLNAVEVFSVENKM